MSDLITDAMVEAARQADELHDPQRMECLNHDGSCCPAFDHNVGDERAHRVRAALEAVAPLIAAKAWDEGYAMSERELDHAYGGHPISPDDPSDLCHECGTGNPYRADRFERAES